MKKEIFLLMIFLVFLPFSSAIIDDCNKQCLVEGSSLGTCRTECDSYETQAGGVAGCTTVGTASIIIGTTSIERYQNDEPYIDQDEDDPDWIWIIRNLKQNRATSLVNTSDESTHTGPIIGVKNKFDATSLANENQPLSVGGQYCFPGNIVCFTYEENTVSLYAAYKVRYTTADLSSYYASWSSKPTILIESLDVSDGIRTQRANYDIPNITSDVETDKIWLAYNNSNYVAIFYEDNNNNKQLAGHVLVDQTTDNVNIADINYQQTKDTNVQINLKGSSGTADNLDIVLDILGDIGLVATDGYDDVTISLSHAASGNFDGIGITPGVAESSEIVWRSSDIGTKTVNLMTLYGLQILNPYGNGASDTISLQIPADQVKAKIKLSKTHSLTTNTTTVTSTTPEQLDPLEPTLASELTSLRDNNIIVVGEPCTNALVPALFGITCTDWILQPEQAMIKIVRNGNNSALLVTGTSAEYIQKAVNVLTEDYDKLEGSEVRIISQKREEVNSSQDLFGSLNRALTDLSSRDFDSLSRESVIVSERSSFSLNLSRYPYPFLLGNSYNKLKIVYSEKGNIQDSLGAYAIAESLANFTGRTVFTTVNQSTSGTETSEEREEIPLGSSLGEENYFNSYFTATQDFENRFFGTKYRVHDQVVLFNNGPSVETSLSSSEDAYGTSAYIELKEGYLRYYYVFDEAIKLEDATPDGSFPMKFLDEDLLITEVANENFLSEHGQEYLLNVGESVEVEDNSVTLEGASTAGVVLNLNGQEEIINYGIRRSVEELNIKPVAGFTQSAAKCCCFNVFSYFR